MPERLSRSQTKAHERRARYSELRRSGMREPDAAAEVGVHGIGSQHLYERWFQAAERGETPVPGSRDPRRRRFG